MIGFATRERCLAASAGAGVTDWASRAAEVGITEIEGSHQADAAEQATRLFARLFGAARSHSAAHDRALVYAFDRV